MSSQMPGAKFPAPFGASSRRLSSAEEPSPLACFAPRRLAKAAAARYLTFARVGKASSNGLHTPAGDVGRRGRREGKAVTSGRRRRSSGRSADPLAVSRQSTELLLDTQRRRPGQLLLDSRQLLASRQERKAAASLQLAACLGGQESAMHLPSKR